MDLELSGKTAVICGGSRGIGKAIAIELAKEGVSVAIAARDREVLERTAAAIGQVTGGDPVPYVECDTRDRTSVEAMARTLVDRWGHIDILVNCAAQPGGLVFDFGPEADEPLGADLDTKVLGYLRTCQAVAPSMRAQGWGRIVNIGGLSGREGRWLSGMRNTALVHLSRTLSHQLGKDGITVNTVHPGLTRTERTDEEDAQRIRSEGITREAIEKERRGYNDLGRIVDAAEIGWLVAFLCSPKGVAITGESISAGGGAGTAVYP